MTKITTDDCKKFITEFHKNNRHIEKIRFGITENNSVNEDIRFLSDILLEKNWKRLFKRNPERNFNENCVYVTGQTVNSYAEPQSHVNFNDIKCVRGFDMITADGQIAYLVLEMKDGTLHLGDYIGD